MHTRDDLIKCFSNIGIKRGDTLLIHSSYKSLGEIEGGAEGFFDALLSHLGEEGTLMLPAFTYMRYGISPRGWVESRQRRVWLKPQGNAR